MPLYVHSGATLRQASHTETVHPALHCTQSISKYEGMRRSRRACKTENSRFPRGAALTRV
eukprot:3763137-Pyramimonas_sp.AAC.1